MSKAELQALKRAVEATAVAIKRPPLAISPDDELDAAVTELERRSRE